MSTQVALRLTFLERKFEHVEKPFSVFFLTNGDLHFNEYYMPSYKVRCFLGFGYLVTEAILNGMALYLQCENMLN